MFEIELLHTYAPDQARREAVKVVDNTAEHLTYAERRAVEEVGENMDRLGNTLAAYSMQHVGPIGDALDAGSTVAAAGHAVCQFMLTRALMNPNELAAAKTAVAECWNAVGALAAKLIGPNSEVSHDMAQYVAAKEFLANAETQFVPLFEDLERHARTRFPGLGPQKGERKVNV